MGEDSFPNYEYLALSYAGDHVLEVKLNRAKKRNAMSVKVWKEIGHCFQDFIPTQARCRSVLFTGDGPIFSAGIDLSSSLVSGGGEEDDNDVARTAFKILREGGSWQAAWKAINDCPKPVIAAIHGGCYGAALEMVAFCDIRMCTKDAVFQAPEVDIGLAADIGGNQMLPKIIGNDSLLRELQMSGRKLTAAEALSFGLVSRVTEDHEDLKKQSLELATTIASKSPIALTGIKTFLNFTRDHSVEDSLKYALAWNSAMVQANDIKVAGMSFVSKQKPEFNNAPSLTDTKSKL